MNFLNFLPKFSIILALLLPFIGCVDDESDANDPASAFASAREYYDDENFEIAVQKLGEFKSRFPYSKLAALAELFVANSHFELGNYEEAAIDYKQFVKLHPNHDKVPFAMYRIGESYWIDAPEDVDSDQELTQTAIDEWQNLLDDFPSSKYAKIAKEKITIGERRIAESHEFIADFYCKMEIYHACAYRFIKILEQYPQYKDLRKKSLSQASEALLEIAVVKKQNPKSDKNIFFQRMTWQEIEDKAKTFAKLAAKIPDSSKDDD